MPYGPLPPKRLPKQDSERVLLLLERWHRAAIALARWSEKAKECVDFLEGRQWTAEQIAALENQGRPALYFNKIRPLVNLVCGYFRNNRTDVKILPGHDGTGTQEVSDALNVIFKAVDEDNELKWTDAETFLDGITTGRGYQDLRLNFMDNDFGDIDIQALDPFTVYPDPDLQHYDVNKGSHISTSKWVSVEEIEFTYGKPAADLISPFLFSGLPWTSFPHNLYDVGAEEHSPIRSFAMDEIADENMSGFRDMFEDMFIDRARKNVRLVDMQYYRTERVPVFIDLETGERAPIPREWDQAKIAKVMAWAESKGNPMVTAVRPHRVPYWTTMVGDLMVYNRKSPYSTFTINSFFPYFRRGVTQGVVQDLIDPQKEVNKRRLSEIEIVSRTSQTGWQWHEDALEPDEEQRLRKYGGTPGYNQKWKGSEKPSRIDPSPPPLAMERLEDRARNDMREISGINEAALGELQDSASASGRAVEARQRQAVIGLQGYIDNWSRTKNGQGRKVIELVQEHYTEPRTYRILGENGKVTQALINTQMEGAINNDVTKGRYSVEVDETPMSATFQSAQFEELLLMLEKMQGALPPELFADKLIELSSMPDKAEMKQRVQQALGITEALTGETALQTGVVPTPQPGQNVVPITGGPVA